MKKMMNWEMGTKIAKLLLVIAAVYLGMHYIFPIVLPFFVALLLAHFLYPLAKKIEKKTGMGKTMARSAAYVLFLVGIGGVAAGILYGGYCMGRDCMDDVWDLMDSMQLVLQKCCNRIEGSWGIHTEVIEDRIYQQTQGLTDGAIQYSKDVGWYMMGLLAKVFVTFVAALLMLQDYEKIVEGFRQNNAGRWFVDMLREMKTASGAYLKAQFRIMVLITMVCIIGLWLLRTPYAVGLGLLIGLFDALPFLGTGTVLVPWAIVEVLLGHYGRGAALLGIYLVCSFVRQILEPRLVGRNLGIPPLTVLMSIYIGLQVYGTAGVILGPVSALLIYEIYRCL